MATAPLLTQTSGHSFRIGKSWRCCNRYGKQRAKEYFKGMDETLATKAVPAWLVLDAANVSGKVDRFPTREEIDVPIEEHFIVELYSK